MATRFEIILQGDSPIALRAAGEEALSEIERVENQLSLYRPHTEIAQVNARAAFEPVKVSPPVFALLEVATRINQETLGAFDITIAPLVKCWGFMGGTGQKPPLSQIAQARELVGMKLVELDPQHLTVQFLKEGVMLDLGAIGKGFAIEQAVQILRDLGIEHALIHGGTSTVYAIGNQLDGASWKITLPMPPGACSPDLQLPCLMICDEALSVSACWGRSFEAEGRRYGHIIDPRTGHPAVGAWLSCVVHSSPTESDALSTALLTLGLKGFDQIRELLPTARILVAGGELTGPTILKRGMNPTEV